jgi:hypothetical protein
LPEPMFFLSRQPPHAHPAQEACPIIHAEEVCPIITTQASRTPKWSAHESN